MTKQEFINDIIGKPWINRAYSMDGCDCFGLVYLYLSKVCGLFPKLTTEYLNNQPFQEAFMAQLNTGEWQQVDSPSGGDIVFMMYSGDVPLHCGVMIDSVNCLHSYGSDARAGQVVIWSLRQVKKHLSVALKLGESPRVEFFRCQK